MLDASGVNPKTYFAQHGNSTPFSEDISNKALRHSFCGILSILPSQPPALNPQFALSLPLVKTITTCHHSIIIIFNAEEP